MMISTLELLVFINQAIYCYTLVPLILENYRLKTARGISDSLVFILLNAVGMLSFYFFCLDFPTSYRLAGVVQLLLIWILIIQRFWYDKFVHKIALGIVYLVSMAAMALLLPLAFGWPYQVGHIAGWIGVILVIANRIPQIIKVQQERSVFGFSYGFVFFLGLAGLMEVSIVLAYGLPMQTLMTASWSLASFLIFTAQFYAFSWRGSIHSTTPKAPSSTHHDRGMKRTK